MKTLERIRGRLLLLGLVLVLLPACNDAASKPTDEEPTGYPAATSITQLLENLKLAYEELNYEEYARLLHEDFTFVFDPRDVGPGRPWEWENDTWGLIQDLESIRHMFGGEPNLKGQIVERIQVSFDAGTPQTSTEDPEWQMVLLTAVDLEAHATEQATGDQWILQTTGNYEGLLHVVQTQAEGESMVWKIIRWEDLPPPGLLSLPCTEDASWGAIKLLYL